MMNKKLGILGAGNMGTAILRGLLSSQKTSLECLRISDESADRLDALRQKYNVAALSNLKLAQFGDVIILAVKPPQVRPALDEIAPAINPNKLLISIAAGVPLSVYEQHLPDKTRVIRAMPNAPALALAGITALAPGAHAQPQDIDEAIDLFGALGVALRVSEPMLDAVTGLSGSGPAYVMLVIEALADGGVKMGLPREQALLLATHTVLGAARLLLESGKHPAELKDMVTSPGGTTIAGLHRLEAGGLRRALIDAVESATLRSKELGLKA